MNKILTTAIPKRFVMLLHLLLFELSFWISTVETLDSLLVLEYEHLIDVETTRAYDHLKNQMKTQIAYIGNKQDKPFEDIMISFPVPNGLFHEGSFNQDDKFFIGTNTIKEIGKNFTVYAFGTAGVAKFEEHIAALGANVYAFDCTDKMRPQWNGKFIFNNWCLGKQESFEENFYSGRAENKTFLFYSLPEIKAKLGHTTSHVDVDVLKMDIEGFEWNILESEIVHGDENSLPKQLLFELHTQGANPRYVPPNIVKNKTRNEVNQLIMALYQRGYRVLKISINPGDIYCAEFVLYRISNGTETNHYHNHNHYHNRNHNRLRHPQQV